MPKRRHQVDITNLVIRPVVRVYRASAAARLGLPHFAAHVAVVVVAGQGVGGLRVGRDVPQSVGKKAAGVLRVLLVEGVHVHRLGWDDITVGIGGRQRRMSTFWLSCGR